MKQEFVQEGMRTYLKIDVDVALGRSDGHIGGSRVYF